MSLIDNLISLYVQKTISRYFDFNFPTVELRPNLLGKVSWSKPFSWLVIDQHQILLLISIPDLSMQVPREKLLITTAKWLCLLLCIIFCIWLVNNDQYKSVKAYMAMLIGIMSSNSLALLGWGLRCFRERRRKHDYTCSCCILLSLGNILSFNQAIVNRHYPQYLSTLLPALLHFCRKTFLKTTVYN